MTMAQCDQTGLLVAPEWKYTVKVRADGTRVTFKFRFIQGHGVPMPCAFGMDPVYGDTDLQTILRGEGSYEDELTKTQMKKLQSVYERHGDWMHPTAKVILGKMCVGLGTFTFLGKIPNLEGAALFTGPRFFLQSKWYEKLVCIRAFVVKPPPSFLADISGARTKVEKVRCGGINEISTGHDRVETWRLPGVDVSVKGALHGAVPWSKHYCDLGCVQLKVVMKEYIAFFKRSRSDAGEAPIGVSFIMGDKEVDDDDGLKRISELWPITSKSESMPRTKKPRLADDKLGLFEKRV